MFLRATHRKQTIANAETPRQAFRRNGATTPPKPNPENKTTRSILRVVSSAICALFDLINENVTEPDNEQIIDLPLSKVKPNPYQPRKEFDKAALNDLASSIKEHGVIQPIIVKENAGEFIIIAGERRYRASLLAERETIPAIVRS